MKTKRKKNKINKIKKWENSNKGKTQKINLKKKKK